MSQREQHAAQCANDLQDAVARMNGQLPDPTGCTQLSVLLLCDLKSVLEAQEYERVCDLLALGLRGISLEWALHQQQNDRTVTEMVEDSASGTDSPPTAH
jgi:hypothetical protein